MIFSIIALVICLLSVAGAVRAEPASADEADFTTESLENVELVDGDDELSSEAGQEESTENESVQDLSTEAGKNDSATVKPSEQPKEESPSEKPSNGSADESKSDDEESENLDDFADSSQAEEITEFLRGQSRASNLKTAQDPRYTCGLSIGLLFDASGSTAKHANTLINATQNVLDTLHGTGSSVGIHTFAATSPTNPALGNLAPTYLDDEGYAKATNYVSRLGAAWAVNTEASNMSAGLKSMQNAEYDVVIVVSDGLVYRSDRTRPMTVAGISDEDLMNVMSAANDLSAAGTSIVSVYVNNPESWRVSKQVFNSQPRFGNRQRQTAEMYFPSNVPLLPGTSIKSQHRETNSAWVAIEASASESNFRDTADGGREFKVRNHWWPVWYQWAYSPEDFMQSISDHQEKADDYTAVAQMLEKLIGGCNGVLKIEKEIVNSDGRIQADADLEDFEFTANRALVENDQNVSNVTEKTNFAGDVSFRYVVTTGGSSITITENPVRGGTNYEMVTQRDINAVARCTATDKKSNELPVSYGSGSGIVVSNVQVEKGVKKNSFTISGLGKDDRVTCIVQNKEQNQSFDIDKSPVEDGTLVVPKSENQELTAQFELEVSNTSTSEGVPDRIVEQPRELPGAEIKSVTAEPAGGSPSLVNAKTEFVLDGANDEWVLTNDKARFANIAAGESKPMIVTVTYVVKAPETLADSSSNLTCRENSENDGLFNEATVFPGTGGSSGDEGSSDSACINGGVSDVSLKKYVREVGSDGSESAFIDAQDPESALVLTPLSNSYLVKLDITNSGTVPLDRLDLEEYRLRENGQANGDPVEFNGLRCEANGSLGIRTDGNAIEFVNGSSLAPGSTISCTYTATDGMVPPQAAFYGGEAKVTARPVVVKSQELNIADFQPTSSDPAWVLRMPAAVGDLPESGGRGVQNYLLLGLILLTSGIFGLRKTQKI